MSEYDKIWIEVDVEQDRDKKTEKMSKIMGHLMELDEVKNVTKITYQLPMMQPD